MTNFEKWKAGLTAEKFLDLVDGGFDCDKCPAVASCVKHEEGCRDVFKKWAMETREAI